MFTSDPQWVEGQEQRIATINRCDVTTARALACASWGFYQLLGANIYAQGCTLDLIEFLSDEHDYSPLDDGEALGAQSAMFSKFIAGHGFRPTEPVTSWTDARFLAFAEFYNGPGATAAYANAMKRAAGLAPIAGG